jgi:hypothetical protein
MSVENSEVKAKVAATDEAVKYPEMGPFTPLKL